MKKLNELNVDPQKEVPLKEKIDNLKKMIEHFDKMDAILNSAKKRLENENKRNNHK